MSADNPVAEPDEHPTAPAGPVVSHQAPSDLHSQNVGLAVHQPSDPATLHQPTSSPTPPQRTSSIAPNPNEVDRSNSPTPVPPPSTDTEATLNPQYLNNRNSLLTVPTRTSSTRHQPSTSSTLETANTAHDEPTVPPSSASEKRRWRRNKTGVVGDGSKPSSLASNNANHAGAGEALPKPKEKKGGFLSFLCCTSADSKDNDTSGPGRKAKAASGPQSGRVSPPPGAVQRRTDPLADENDVQKPVIAPVGQTADPMELDEKGAFKGEDKNSSGVGLSREASKTAENAGRSVSPIATSIDPTPSITRTSPSPVDSDQDMPDADEEGETRGRRKTPVPVPVPNASQADVEDAAEDVGMVSIPQKPAIETTEGEKQQHLLPPLSKELTGKKCLVLDLDETLVHSSFKVLHQADFTIPVEIEGSYHNVYVIKRPGVDQFMKRVGELYEIVIFTASVAKYGDPLLDQLDIHRVVHHRLFRDSCFNHQGNYVKDLSQLGRDLKDTIIIDNSPTSYIFHPQHAVPISSWFSDAHDNELLDLLPVLEDLSTQQVRDVTLVLDVAL